jgi:hypothetical protein
VSSDRKFVPLTQWELKTLHAAMNALLIYNLSKGVPARGAEYERIKDLRAKLKGLREPEESSAGGSGE